MKETRFPKKVILKLFITKKYTMDFIFFSVFDAINYFDFDTCDCSFEGFRHELKK